MMPGDPEIHIMKQKKLEGIPLDEAVWAELAKLADTCTTFHYQTLS